MTITATGAAECDGCGRALENGNIFECVIVARLNPDAPGQMENLHLCTRPIEGSKKKPCGDKIDRILEHRKEAHERHLDRPPEVRGPAEG